MIEKLKMPYSFTFILHLIEIKTTKPNFHHSAPLKNAELAVGSHYTA